MGRIKKYKTTQEKIDAKKMARKKYVEKNKEKVAKQVRDWMVKNGKILDKPKRTEKEKKEIYNNWRKNNLEKCREISRKYRINNPDKVKENNRKSIEKRKKNDIVFRVKCNLKSMIAKTFKRNGYKKSSRTHEILGCYYEELKNSLESNFESWMNWENYGKYNGELNYGWDIDHIIPLSSAKTEEELLKLCHYTNLQPLCSKINRDIKKNLTNITFELSMDF